ncbi:MAG TPA: RNase adapter RapZ, partial [Alphaproteobacteria bacterium]|nr:RNase adapter RapZ [Alphaproteobacteria bacterium]
EPLRQAADLLLDSSRLKLADLKLALSERFAIERRAGLSVFVTSFSYRNGLPREADLVFDVRFLANPHYEDALRELDGRDPEVAVFIAADSSYGPFFARLLAMLLSLLPAYEREGKAYLTIALGCTGGRHRSVFVAEGLGRALAREGWHVRVRHRDLPA